MFPLRDDRPTSTPPVVTIFLIAACTLVFLYELSLDDFSRSEFIGSFSLIPARFLSHSYLLRAYGVTPQFGTRGLITSLFLHGGWSHLIGNMIFLWAFGKSLEDAMGHLKFLSFYLLCGVAAGLVHIMFNAYSRVPTVGASGAIAGVMGAYLLTFPRAQIRTLIIVVVFITTADIPAAFILIYWFVVQLFSGAGSIAQTQVSDSGTAWFAHIGGFLTGMILVKLMGTRSRYRAVQSRW